MTVRVIAETRERFSRFGPYVASIARDGTVSFWASLPDGGDGVFTHDGDRISVTPLAAVARSVYSHPDINGRGDVCAYAELTSGGQGVVAVRGGQPVVVVETGGALASVGPLGPTMNEAGAIAFRATLGDGGGAVLVADDDGVRTVAKEGGDVAEIQGLPVINDRGDVAYRAVRADGTRVIYRCDRGGAPAVAVETGPDVPLRDLAPSTATIDHGGRIACGAQRADGSWGIYSVTGDGAPESLPWAEGFDSVLGVLVTQSGHRVVYATPPGGTLGVHAPSGPIVSIGDELAGSTVTSFVLNPVSINESGAVVLRLELADGRELIARVDPASPVE